ncbi:DUF2125 domain-containing protein [Devosia sp. 2618]|uniref:DUF2125 domain-containing protein n=1 Tax=Devosia sp. 2618 TaxID=3156454 RepID=UPI00339769DB
MKKRIIILGCVVLAVVIAWSAAWVVLSGLVKDNIEQLANADGVTTPRIACETLNISGFPFRFDADCVNAEIVSGDFTVTTPGIRASIRVYAPTHLLASAKGPLHLTDNFTGTRNGVDWSTLEASIRLDNWRIARASVSGADVVWTDTLFGNSVIAQSPLVEVHLFDIPEQHNAEAKTAALAGYVRAQNAAWPGLTLTDASAEVQVELSGLPDDVRNWDNPLLLQSMQQAGGALKIVAIHATDAAATLDASGELTLDAQGFPEGQISIKSTGVAERVGPMIAEPWRTLVFGTPAPDGSYANQLNFHGGAISSGLVPIATVHPLF